jgi:hypothetical protein
VRRDLGKKDILRFGVVGLSKTLLSGSLESLRVACMNKCSCCVKSKRQDQREGALLKYLQSSCHWSLERTRNQTIRRFWRDPDAVNANQMCNYINSIKERGVHQLIVSHFENCPQPTGTFHGATQWIASTLSA